MAIGPVQLLVIGFDEPDFEGEILDELTKLKEHDMLKVIDALVVYKDDDGEMVVADISNLTPDEAQEFSGKVAALIGLGIAGEEGMEAGYEAGSEMAAEQGGVHLFDEEDAWDVLDEIPNGSAAALVLIEHHWAVPLRDAVWRAGGMRLASEFVDPLDLIEIGLLEAEEAEGHTF